jgi:hypothetical protein
MKFKAVTIGALLLLTILVVSTVQSIGISTVSAYQGSGVFCPNRYIPEYPPGDTENEIVLSTQACYYIAYYLWEHYYPGTCYFMFGDPLWGQYSPVVPESYTIILDELEYYSDKVTVFSKGHCTPWGYNGQHYQLLCTFEPDAAKDSVHIWPGTDQGKRRFDFIWHCGTARSYPVPPPYYDPDGPYGMPFTFTHNVAMTKYGSSGPCVFLGWDWMSPQFENTIPQNQYWQWAQFAVAIFYYMHYDYWDLQYALNQLSLSIYGTYFSNSPLYNDLVVWGNMNMALYY